MIIAVNAHASPAVDIRKLLGAREPLLVPRLGAIPLQQLTADRLTAMYADLRESGRRDGKGLSPRTVRYIHGTIRQALEHAVDSGLLPRNVAVKAKPPSAKQ